MRMFISCFAALALAGAATAGDFVELQPISTGFSKKMGGYRPMQVVLSSTKPDTIKKVPGGVENAGYGVLKFGAADAGAARVYHIVVGQSADGGAKLYFDANGNGDLTDDAAVEWTGSKRTDRAGASYMQFSGAFAIPLDAGDKPALAGLTAYSFSNKKDVLFYYRDYGYEGELDLGGRKYLAALSDDAATGDFRGAAEGPASGIYLLLDVNGNKSFDRRGERYDVRKPFNIGGTTYEIADMAPSGRRFRVIKSSRTVEEIAPAPDLANGKTFPAFEARDMDGNTVKFPGDYKGKVVLVDFWATWCGPCMGEVPNLVKAYDEFHPKGFEVIGISLDKADAADKIKDVTGKNKMTWRQIYDGGMWKAALAVQYDIHSIPAPFLVDGDTGEILASKSDARGAALPDAIKSALAKKAAHK